MSTAANVRMKRKSEWEDVHDEETNIEDGSDGDGVGGNWSDCVFYEQRVAKGDMKDGDSDDEDGEKRKGWMYVTWRPPPKLRIIPPSMPPESTQLPPQTVIQAQWHRATWSWLMQGSRLSLHHRSPTPLHRCMLEDPLQYIDWDRERCAWVHPPPHAESEQVARRQIEFDMADEVCTILRKRGVIHTFTIPNDKSALGGNDGSIVSENIVSDISGSVVNDISGNIVNDISGSVVDGIGISTETWIYDPITSAHTMRLETEIKMEEVKGETVGKAAAEIKCVKLIWIQRTGRPVFTNNDTRGSVIWDVSDFLFQLAMAREMVAEYFHTSYTDTYPTVLVTAINEYL
jgi:hypothetical protein